MIKECNFKSKIIHRDKFGCNLTPNEIVCPGEENCIIYQSYKNSLKKKMKQMLLLAILLNTSKTLKQTDADFKP